MKHRFFALHEGFYEGVEQRLSLLRTACERRDVEFIALDSLRCDYSALPQLGAADLLYNCARGSHTLESILLNEQVTTFYRQNPTHNVVTCTSVWTYLHEKAGLPAPRTIHAFTADRELLARYVEFLGGFPIVLKCYGGTRGIGTIRVDGWETLISLSDHLVAQGQKGMLRQFIDAPYGVRAMVLGDQVVATLKFFFPAGDFRNAALLSDIRYEPAELSAEHEALCVRATHLANLEMSGVDLLFDRQSNVYLLEINFPTGFQSAAVEPWCIHHKWVDYLVEKSVRRGSL